MARYINSQKSSRITGSVSNRVTGTVSSQKLAKNQAINSQLGSEIRGDVTNTVVLGRGSHTSFNESGYLVSLLRQVWKAIPGLNGAVQICDKLFHLFRH